MPTDRCGTAGVLLTAAACLVGAAHVSAQSRRVPSAVASEGTPSVRAWSATERLSWDEYRGPAPIAGSEAARTVYLLQYESRCHGREFTFDVTAVFVPDQSWVKGEILASPRENVRVLQHEQTHFDLTEVYARRMRKYFAELYDPCGQSDEALDASINRFVREEAAAQQRYDQETENGLRAGSQRSWGDRVVDMLAALQSFARP